MMRVVAVATMLLVDYLQAVSKEDGKYSESVHELPAGIHSEVDQRHQIHSDNGNMSDLF